MAMAEALRSQSAWSCRNAGRFDTTTLTHSGRVAVASSSEYFMTDWALSAVDLFSHLLLLGQSVLNAVQNIIGRDGGQAMLRSQAHTCVAIATARAALQDLVPRAFGSPQRGGGRPEKTNSRHPQPRRKMQWSGVS